VEDGTHPKPCASPIQERDRQHMSIPIVGRGKLIVCEEELSTNSMTETLFQRAFPRNLTLCIS
jgi:hypothetical protein